MVNMTRMTLIKHLMPKCYLVKMFHGNDSNDYWHDSNTLFDGNDPNDHSNDSNKVFMEMI